MLCIKAFVHSNRLTRNRKQDEKCCLLMQGMENMQRPSLTICNRVEDRFYWIVHIPVISNRNVER